MSTWAPGTAHGYRHEALLYHDGDEFLETAIGFIEEAVEHGEPVLVALAPPKIAALQAKVKGAGSKVLFANMEELGRNPAQIIPAWQAFLAEHPTRWRPCPGNRRTHSGHPGRRPTRRRPTA